MTHTLEMTFAVEGLQNQKAKFAINSQGTVLVTFPGLFMSLRAPAHALQFTPRPRVDASPERVVVAYAEDAEDTSGWQITLAKRDAEALQTNLWAHIASMDEAAE